MMRYVLILIGLFCWMGSALAAIDIDSEKPLDLTTSTFTQVSTEEAVHDVRLSRHTLTFKLDDPIWHHTYNNSPIDFVGSKVTINSITLPDLATNTANLKHVPSVTLLNANGEPFLDANGNPLLDANGKEIKEITSNDAYTQQQIQLPSVNGTHVAAIPYVYTFPSALPPLETGKTYTLRLNPNSNLTTPPLLPVFRNASSQYTDADQSSVRIDGGDTRYSPYLAFNGKMTMKRFIYELSATADKSPHSLNKLLTDDGFSTSDDDNDDNKDTMVIVRLKAMDTILTVDRSLTKAAMIVATDTPASTWNQEGTGDWTVKQRAGTVRFIEGDYRFTGPWDFRDVTGAKGEIKMIRLEYYDKEGNPKTTTKTADNKTETVAVPIPRGLWNPKSFALYCDLEFSAYPNMSEDPDSWFGRNPITIPSGRSVRIVTHVDEANRPKLAFTDATSRLALAIPTNEAHVLSHYRNLIEQNSGILRFVSPFEIHEKTGTESTGHTASLVLGVDNLPSTAPSVQTLESYNTTTFTKALVLGYGVDNKAQYVQHTGNVTIGGEGLFIGQKDPALAKYFLKDGQLETTNVTFGHKAHDAALIVGDGEGNANSAIANLSQLLASDVSNTTEITGTAEVIINTDGQLVLNGDLDMTPALRRRMTMNGGTLKAKGATPAYTFGSDFVNGGGLSINGNVTIDASEATDLTIDAIKGISTGTLTFKGNVDIGTIGDFRGTLEATAGSSVTIRNLYGINSDILFGDLGENGTTGVETILAIARTSNYRGTLAFKASDYPIIDVAETPETTLNARIRVDNGQTLRIRLDQFADATILWPDTIDSEKPPKLIFIESGAYGGVLTFRHLPNAVAEGVVFEYYNNANITTPHVVESWVITPNEDGAYDTLEWEFPNFTGYSAWVDAEFNGNGNNTGWWTLIDQKGELVNYLRVGHDSDRSPHYGHQLDDAKYFTETRNPRSQGVKLHYRPYIALRHESNLIYPDEWSAAIRLIAPNKANTTILALGSSARGWAGDAVPPGEALILATGNTAQDLVLWHIDKNDGTLGDDGIPVGMKKVAEARVADIVNIPHVFSAVCDREALTVYLDGRFLAKYPLPNNWRGLATGGLQVGQLLDDSSNAPNILAKLQAVNEQDGGSVDYIRFYKGALTAEAMTALAVESPAIYRNARYVRNVTEDGLWEDTANEPWYKETWNGNAWVRAANGEARPAEGAEIRLFVKGERTLQVNPTRLLDVGFLSASRTYSMLNVLPLVENGTPAASTLHLVPLDGEITEAHLKGTSQTPSRWFSDRASDNSYLYGSLNFTGGQKDAIHDHEAHATYDDAIGALGVHCERSATAGNETTVVGEPVIGDTKMVYENRKYKQKRTVTQTRTLTRGASGGSHVAIFAPSAGVAMFSPTGTAFIGAVTETDGEDSYLEVRVDTRSITQVSEMKTTGTGSTWTEFSPKIESLEKVAWTEGSWIDQEIDTDNNGEVHHQAILEIHADYSLLRGFEEEESRIVALTGPIIGNGVLRGNSDEAAEGQESKNVWVTPFTDNANWYITDVTETRYGEGTNSEGRTSGLFAKILQIPGRLYLDLSSVNPTTTDFSSAAWYRYGYAGTKMTPEPVPATDNDKQTALAFQIRVKGEHTLTMDSARTGIATLHVEPAANAEAPVLKLVGNNNKYLQLSKQLITFVRLEDVAEEPALLFNDEALLHGHTTGTYAFKNRTWDRALLRDSIATLEAHGTNNVFKQNFELRNTNLVIADNAILEQEGDANHLWAKSLTMGNGATFRFHAAGQDAEANGVVFSENVKLTGETATLHGYGQVDDPDADAGQLNLNRCNFTAAGIEGPTDKAAVLTLNSASDEADKKERWICYTANLVDHTETGGKLGLTKIGTGIMAFRSPTPPSVTGPVSVNEGILRVGTKSFSDDALNAEQHLDAAIGHNGLYVAEGASLEPNHYANPEDVIACIPKGQTLSGTGTIGGVLRLNSGAELENCAGMTIRKMVVDGSTLPDIKVTLPTDIEDKDILFHMLNDSARAEVRRRFYATKGTQRWDVGVNHDAGETPKVCQSHYVVYKPGVPVPTDPTTTDGNAFTSAFTNTMARYYQGYSVSRLLSSTGYTKYVNADSNHKLNASEIENAFRCFSHVWTFARNEAPNTATSVYLDDEQSLLMAYEFGISRMAIRDFPTTGDTPTRYLIVEVKVENALGKAFGAVTGANNVADFQLNTQVAFYRVHEDEKTAPTLVDGVQEIVSFDATDLTGPSEQTHTPGFRAFAIPFDEARFPMGTTSLSVKVTL